MSLPTPVRVRFQDLRNFTVQVRRARDQYIVGAGLLVSETGKIVTCRHVVKGAGVDLDAPGPHEVCVAFPNARPDEPSLRASVAAHLAPDEDDVVLLQLLDDGGSLGPGQQVAKLGRAESSFWHKEFRCYGFPDLGAVSQLWATGSFRDSIYVPLTAYRTKPVQLDSNDLVYGMSGAGVLDTDPRHNRNVIAGIVFKTNIWVEETGKNQDVAWAVDPEVLGAPPFDLPLYETVPMSEAPQPKTDIAAAQRVAAAELGVRLFGAPPSLGDAWAARRELVEVISADWGSDERRVVDAVNLVSLPGCGGRVGPGSGDPWCCVRLLWWSCR